MIHSNEKNKAKDTVIQLSNPYKPWLVVSILILSDLFSLWLSSFLAYQLTYFSFGFDGKLQKNPEILYQVFFILFLNILLVMNFSNYYQGFGRSNFSDFRNILINVSVSYLFGLIIILAFNLDLPAMYFFYFFSWLFSMILFLACRLTIQNYGARFVWWRMPIIIVGNKEQVKRVLQKTKLPNRIAFNPVAVISFEQENIDKFIMEIPYIELTDEQIGELKMKKIKMAIVAESSGKIPDNYNEIINKLIYVFPHLVYEIQSPFFEIASIKLVDFFDKSAIQISYNLLNPVSFFVKRIMDIFLCVLSLVFVIPLYFIIGLAIKLDSKGPIIYKQNRVGLNGQLFSMYKFRTMIKNADEKLNDILNHDIQKNHEFMTYRKLQHDPRITRIGRILRKYSLDELPQIINIMRGEMSWVGPRAYLPEEIKLLRSKAGIIQNVKPGLTGWWQVNGRNELTFKERMQMDEQYISRYTLWMDAYILCKTIKVVIQGKGI